MTIDLEAALQPLPRDSKVQAIYLFGRILWEGRGVLRSVAADPDYDRPALAVVTRLVDELESATGKSVRDLPEENRHAISASLDRILRRILPPAVDRGSVERELVALRKFAI